MSEALYLMDCYKKEFDAKTVSVSGDGLSVVLDYTCFYPASGGQPNDIGKIVVDDQEFRIVDVFKKDGEIVHKVDKSGLKPGMVVHGIIDWERRYKLMRHHTASHILSSLIHNETSAEITGNQLYEDKARVDFSLDKFDRELMKSFEEKTNKLIDEALPVHFRILEREEAFKIPSLVKLRMQLPESIRKLRIVDIGDFDTQACGGTHLRNTSEIGHIEIFNLENKGKDRKRMYFRLKS